jgi:hypothetical protein
MRFIFLLTLRVSRKIAERLDADGIVLYSCAGKVFPRAAKGVAMAAKRGRPRLDPSERKARLVLFVRPDLLAWLEETRWSLSVAAYATTVLYAVMKEAKGRYTPKQLKSGFEPTHEPMDIVKAVKALRREMADGKLSEIVSKDPVLAKKARAQAARRAKKALDGWTATPANPNEKAP